MKSQKIIYLLAAGLLAMYAGSAVAADNGFTTIMWGRSNWQATSAKEGNCIVVPGLTRTLKENADDLLTFKDGIGKPLSAVGGVVVNRTAQSGHPCFRGYTTQASWQDMDTLRKPPYNWTFISQGMNYENMAEMDTDEERIHESLDTLPLMYARGHQRAWGAFNYPNNKQNKAAQEIVTREFAFGRAYGQTVNQKQKITSFPYKMITLSVTGGRCVKRNLPCSNFPVKNNKVSVSVDRIADILSPGPGEWGVAQFYRLVQGKYGAIGQGFAWDCTSADWRERWTSQPELTCRESFLDALRMRRGKAENVDPATVAQRWDVQVPRN